MELRDFLKILKSNYYFIVIFAVLGILFAWLTTAKISQGYQLSQVFYLHQTENPNDIYGGYYSQEKARNFTDTAIAIIESPDFATQAVSLSAKKLAPQVVRITASAKSQQVAKDSLFRANQAINTKLASLNGSDNLKMQPVGDVNFSSQTVLDKKIVLVFGTAVGTIFAIFVIGLKTYFRI